MAYGRSKMLLKSEEAQLEGTQSVEPAPIRPPTRLGKPPLRGVLRKPVDERSELERLRTANAQLVRELAVLREREAQAQRLADRDGLTGLYNRRCMVELLDSNADAARQWQCVGLLFIDLNGFKGINDEHGHAAGDKILTTVAARISARVRTGDFVCRYGGDEFVVILPSVPDAAAVSRVAEAIRERVALPYRIRGCELHLTAAIGESMYPHDGDSVEELLHRSDQAMYRLKARAASPMLFLGGTRQPRPSRRRNDKALDRGS
jgi:diguanylate cyclase (GGDEF)-like protein